MTPSGKAWVSIQYLLLRGCASISSSGVPANSGLKWNQFNCGILAGCENGTIGSAGGAGGCTGGTGDTTGGITGVTKVQVVFHQPYLFALQIM